jgi:hypothetical protein
MILMLENNAFKQLKKWTLKLLHDKTPFNAKITEALDFREPQEFRIAIAYIAAKTLFKALDVPFTPIETEDVRKFIKEISRTIACLADEVRPRGYANYTPNAFAEMLIQEFCRVYVQLNEDLPTDECIASLERVFFILPKNPPAISLLREELRIMPVSQFAEYHLLD